MKHFHVGTSRQLNRLYYIIRLYYTYLPLSFNLCWYSFTSILQHGNIIVRMSGDPSQIFFIVEPGVKARIVPTTPSPYNRYEWQNMHTIQSRFQSVSSNSGAYPAAGFWTAGTAAELLGDWKWITTGQTIDFEQFNATDPNTGGHIGVSADQKSGCLALSKSMSFKISRQPCKTTQHFICERHDSS